MGIDFAKIKKILLISLTNIGDVILTFPVLDVLIRDFPDAEISMVVGPKGESLLKGHPRLKKLYIYNKRQPTIKTIQWVWSLKRERFDLVVDLRNSATPFMIGPRFRTSPFMKRIDGEHMRRQHLRRLKSIYPFQNESESRFAVHISGDDRLVVDNIINSETGTSPLVVVSPGAADHKKQWMEDGFAAVCDNLAERHAVKIVFVGDINDRKVVLSILKKMSNEAINLCGRVSLPQLAHLYHYAILAIANDSAPMHLASYLGVPVLALFGPTDPQQYGPWSQQSVVLKKNQRCEACQNSKTVLEHECMRAISVDDVLEMFKFFAFVHNG